MKFKPLFKTALLSLLMFVACKKDENGPTVEKYNAKINATTDANSVYAAGHRAIRLGASEMVITSDIGRYELTPSGINHWFQLRLHMEDAGNKKFIVNNIDTLSPAMKGQPFNLHTMVAYEKMGYPVIVYIGSNSFQFDTVTAGKFSLDSIKSPIIIDTTKTVISESSARNAINSK